MTTTTTETTTTDKTTVIAVVRSEHYATRLLKSYAATYLVCVCGYMGLDDVTGEAGFRRHMVEMLGHRPQAIEIDRETGAMAIVCTCGDQPPMVADGTAYDLHRVHAEHPTVQPLVPDQRAGNLTPEQFPYTAVLPTSAISRLQHLLADRPELVVVRGRLAYFSRDAITYLASRCPDAHICSGPAGESLHFYQDDSLFALTYRIV